MKSKETMNFNKEQKEQLLQVHGWEKITGYAMDYATPEESNNVIISVEEVHKIVCKEPTNYWFPKGDYEWARDTEEAWECLCDYCYQQGDMDSDEELTAYFQAKIMNLS